MSFINQQQQQQQGSSSSGVDYELMSVDNVNSSYYVAMKDQDEEEDQQQKQSLLLQQSSLSKQGNNNTTSHIDYHLISEQDVLDRYSTDTETGLSSEEAKRRLKRDGPNVITPKRRLIRKIFRFLSHFFSGFCLILWPAAILSILSWKPLGNPHPDVTNLVQGIVLIIVILINATFEIVQEFASGRIMNSIASMLPPTAKVMRDGKITQVEMKKIVVGDIVQLDLGDIVPADLRLIKASSMKLDTSMLTGESEPVSCSLKQSNINSISSVMESRNVAFMGTNCVEGTGLGVVVNTGNRTIMGSITEDAAQTKQQNSSSALHKEITRFVFAVAVLAVMTGSTFVLVWGVWLKKKYPSFMNTSEIISTALGASVAFVPEGLPLCVILTLTLIARKMGKQKVIVKSLMTVETLGCVNIICSDKTGTLTQNRMSVMHVIIGMKKKSAVGSRELQELCNRGNQVVTELLKVCSLCNRAVFQEPIDESLPMHERLVMGDASDTAMLRFAEEYHSVANMRQEYPKLAEIPFNSKNKYMLTVVEQPEELGDNRALLMMKGAAEIMAARCTTILTMDGKEIPLTDSIRDELARYQEELGQSGERVLAVCRRYLDENQYPVSTYNFSTEDDQVNFPTDALCLVGFIALLDKPRPEAAYAIKECNKAGVRVSMVTGDHPTTAVSIARMVGIVGPETECHKFSESKHLSYDFEYKGKKNVPIITDRALAVTGADIVHGLTDSDWDYICAHEQLVFARTTPEHKLTIVRQFQKRKNVVAVTGDGTNDAPAMKNADVGVAMGAGSDVARNTADLILMDNNFASILVGMNYGRLVYENLKKSVIYLLPAGTMCEVCATIANVMFGLPRLISPILMIYHALLTDSANSMTLMFEQPEPEIMTRPPRSLTGERIVNLRLLLQAYLFIGLPEFLCLMTMYFWFMAQFAGIKPRELFFLFDGYKEGFHGMTQKELLHLEYEGQCVFFVALVLVQFGNLLVTRTRKASFFQQPPFSEHGRNWALFVGMFLSLISAIMVVHIPVLQYLMDTRTIPFKFWFAPIAFILFIFCLDEARKLGTRLAPRAFFWSW